MKKQIIVAGVLAVCAVGSVMAQSGGQSPWLVRARAVHIDSDNGGSTTPPLDLAVNNRTIPEVDISYFFNKNIAAELILTTPQKHILTSNLGDLGTLRHLPPTLSVQYHFTELQGFKPYVGLGVNYTRFSDVQLAAKASIDKDSWGLSWQAGVDIPLDKNWSLNLDLKQVRIRTAVYLDNARIGDFKIDPLLAGVGVGYRF
jgi:outer membrane protein